MTGYAITQIEVTNPEDYKEYLAKVTDIVTKFGGEYLVRGGEYQCFEGEWKYPRTVVIKFPSYEKAFSNLGSGLVVVWQCLCWLCKRCWCVWSSITISRYVRCRYVN